jgi:anti-sigma B factor antagonist
MSDPRGQRQSRWARLWALDIAGEARDGVRILVVRGRLGVAGATGLGAALTDELALGQTPILIDLEGVDYMSSAGLLVLQRAATTARDRDIRLALCSLPEPVRLAFDLAALLGEFRIEASREAGVSALAADPGHL